MSYIIMGCDECNQEFRPNFPSFATEDGAYAKLDAARERYPEARSIWVELLKDKDYYLDQNSLIHGGGYDYFDLYVDGEYEDYE